MIKSLEEIAQEAKNAALLLNKTDINIINDALLLIADSLESNTTYIIEQNNIDVTAALENNMDKALLDRLTLDKQRITSLATNLRLVAGLDSPLNKVIYSHQSLQGFTINTIRVPLGVIAMIYEARPNVTTEAMSLSLKSGNATILRGSSSTLNTNKALIQIIKNAGSKVGLPDNFVQLIETTSHEDVTKLVKLNDYIDVVIPRGGERLIQNVVNNATVPIIETGTGNNFAYVDPSACLDKAIDVIVNAKAQRPTVCNSLEKVLVHQDMPQDFYQKLNDKLKEANVAIKACDKTIMYFDKAQAFLPEDLDIEYYDYIIGIKQVESLEKAVELMNTHSSKHSNLILSTDYYNIDIFTKTVDSACVYVNVSTRFSDGVEFGLGSEIGISTQKLHARGPMGLTALTSTKNIITGDHQTRH